LLLHVGGPERRCTGLQVLWPAGRAKTGKQDVNRLDRPKKDGARNPSQGKRADHRKEGERNKRAGSDQGTGRRGGQIKSRAERRRERPPQ
jgi:hypothetical protein